MAELLVTSLDDLLQPSNASSTSGARLGGGGVHLHSSLRGNAHARDMSRASEGPLPHVQNTNTPLLSSWAQRGLALGSSPLISLVANKTLWRGLAMISLEQRGRAWLGGFGGLCVCVSVCVCVCVCVCVYVCMCVCM
jgi:hypothetical protein